MHPQPWAARAAVCGGSPLKVTKMMVDEDGMVVTIVIDVFVALIQEISNRTH